MHGHRALLATVVLLAACTHTLETRAHRACPPPRPHEATNGVGIIGMSLDQRSVGQHGEVDLIVDRVVPDGPAATAGIHAGDRIVTIEHVSTRGMSIADAARRLRGPTDASVALEIATAGHVRDITLIRVAPSELWNGAATHRHSAERAERVRASDVAPAAPITAPPCRQ